MDLIISLNICEWNMIINKQFTFLHKGSNRFYPSPKILLVLHTTYQSTYFIYYSYQDKFKNPRIMKIHQVHQELQAKPFLLFCETCFLFVIHLNFK